MATGAKPKATGTKPRVSINAPKWTAAQPRAFDAIEKRTRVLSDKLTPKDFGEDGNPARGPWADVLADLDAWAAKYKVDIWTTDYRRDALGSTAGAAPVPMAATSCPGTTTSTERFDFERRYWITLTMTCKLRRRQTLLGRCVFSSSPGSKAATSLADGAHRHFGRTGGHGRWKSQLNSSGGGEILAASFSRLDAVAVDDASAAAVVGNQVVFVVALGLGLNDAAATVHEDDIVVAAVAQVAPHLADAHQVAETAVVIAELEPEARRAEAEVELDLTARVAVAEVHCLCRHRGKAATGKDDRECRGTSGFS
jgi:hypothetical protein